MRNAVKRLGRKLAFVEGRKERKERKENREKERKNTMKEGEKK